MGELGRALEEELQDSDVKISYAIDNNVKSKLIESRLLIFNLEYFSRMISNKEADQYKVDAIVVTVVDPNKRYIINYHSINRIDIIIITNILYSCHNIIKLFRDF